MIHHRSYHFLAHGVFLLAFFASVVLPQAVSADHTSEHTIQQLQEQIAALQAQIVSLTGQLEAVSAYTLRNGDRIETALAAYIRQMAGGRVLSRIAAGSKGTLACAKTKGACPVRQGKYLWWYVDWDNPKAPDGWSASAEEFFKKIVTPAVVPAITVISPNGGEIWEKGKTYTVKWCGNGVFPVGFSTVFLTGAKQSSGIYAVNTIIAQPAGITQCTSIGSGYSTFDWTIPSDLPPAKDYYLTLVYKDEKGATPAADKSDAPFSIIPPGAATPAKITASEVQPQASLAPRKTVMPFTAITVTPAVSEVYLNDLTVERTGLSNDAAFQEILLIDKTRDSVAMSGKIDPVTHKAVLTSPWGPIKITNKEFLVAGVMTDTLTAFAGQVVYLDVVEANFSEKGGSKLNTGPLSIRGAGHTINNSLQVGEITIGKTIIYADPAAAKKRFLTFSASNIEDVFLENIVVTDSGGSVLINGASRACVPLNDGTPREICYFKESYPISKGTTLNIETNATLDNERDVRALGRTYGYHLMPRIADVTPPPVSSTTTLVASVSPSNPIKNTLVAGMRDAVLAVADITVSGSEAVSVSQISFAAGTVADPNLPRTLNSFMLYDPKGYLVAGPKEFSGNQITFTDAFTVPVGTFSYTLKANVSSSPALTNVQFTAYPPSWIASGVSSGNAVKPAPANNIVFNPVSIVRQGSFTVSLDPATPAAKTVSPGAIDVPVTVLRIDAVNETVKLTSLALQMDGSGPAKNDIAELSLWDGADKIWKMTYPPVFPGNGVTINFGSANAVKIPANSGKTLTVKITVAKDAAIGDTIAINYDGNNWQKTQAIGLSSGNQLYSDTRIDTAAPKITVSTATVLQASLLQIAEQIVAIQNILNNLKGR